MQPVPENAAWRWRCRSCAAADSSPRARAPADRRAAFDFQHHVSARQWPRHPACEPSRPDRRASAASKIRRHLPRLPALWPVLSRSHVHRLIPGQRPSDRPSPHPNPAAHPATLAQTLRYSGFAKCKLSPRKSARLNRSCRSESCRRLFCLLVSFQQDPARLQLRLGPRNRLWLARFHCVQVHAARQRRKQGGFRAAPSAQENPALRRATRSSASRAARRKARCSTITSRTLTPLSTRICSSSSVRSGPCWQAITARCAPVFASPAADILAASRECHCARRGEWRRPAPRIAGSPENAAPVRFPAPARSVHASIPGCAAGAWRPAPFARSRRLFGIEGSP